MIVSIEKIHSKPFDCSILDIPYIEMAREILNTKIGTVSETSYYQYLNKLLIINGNVWGYIYNEYDCMKRTEVFIEIVGSISENGYNDKSNIRFIKGLPYGKLTFMNENGKIVLIDGHHRMAVLICLGFTEFELHHNYLMPIRNGIK